MTRGGVKEYLEAIRERYIKADRKEKGRLLDEAVQVTGLHRKSLIRSLKIRPDPKRGGKRPRPRKYGPEVVSALKAVWESSDRMCGKRLQPFLPELMEALERHGELALAEGVKERLREMSAATVDRLLKPHRHRGLRRPFGTTKPGSLLKAAIPMRTFAEWDEGRPGFLEMDLVAHCGDSTEGFYLNTLSAVDVATGWVECRGVFGEGPGTGGKRNSPHRPKPALSPPGDRLGQRRRVHQPQAVRLLPEERDHLHPLQALQEERRRPRGAKELVGGAPFDRLRTLQQQKKLWNS